MTLKFTWRRIIQIWWAVFWRWLILNGFTSGIYALVLWATFSLLGHGDWTKSSWTMTGFFLSYIPAAWMAFRIGLQVPFRDFRVQLVSPPTEAW
jgi:hypothetical protein